MKVCATVSLLASFPFKKSPPLSLAHTHWQCVVSQCKLVGRAGRQTQDRRKRRRMVRAGSSVGGRRLGRDLGWKTTTATVLMVFTFLHPEGNYSCAVPPEELKKILL